MQGFSYLLRGSVWLENSPQNRSVMVIDQFTNRRNDLNFCKWFWHQDASRHTAIRPFVARCAGHIDDSDVRTAISRITRYFPAAGAFAGVDVGHKHRRWRLGIAEPLPSFGAVVQYRDVEAAALECLHDQLCDKMFIFDEHDGQSVVHGVRPQRKQALEPSAAGLCLC